MDVFWIIIGIPIAIYLLFALSLGLGSAFRRWNEGENADNEQGKKSLIKTLAIGFVLFIAIGFILSKCEG